MSKSRRPGPARKTTSTTGRKRPRQRLARGGEGLETRGAVAVTVAWMLTLMATLLAVAGTILTRLLASWAKPEAGEPNLLLVLPGLLLFTGIVSGSICLALTVAANRLRRRAPPRAITVFAVAACVLPWVLLILSPFLS